MKYLIIFLIISFNFFCQIFRHDETFSNNENLFIWNFFLDYLQWRENDRTGQTNWIFGRFSQQYLSLWPLIDPRTPSVAIKKRIIMNDLNRGSSPKVIMRIFSHGLRRIFFGINNRKGNSSYKIGMETWYSSIEKMINNQRMLVLSKDKRIRCWHFSHLLFI